MTNGKIRKQDTPSEKGPGEVLEMLVKIGVLESEESMELTADFYRRWKKLQIALDKMSVYDKSRMVAFQEKEGNLADSSQIAMVGAMVPEEGLHKDWIEPCIKMVEIIIDKTIPAWRIP